MLAGKAVCGGFGGSGSVVVGIELRSFTMGVLVYIYICIGI